MQLMSCPKCSGEVDIPRFVELKRAMAHGYVGIICTGCGAKIKPVDGKWIVDEGVIKGK